ncbi:MAG: hypothetical protein KIS95_00425 [Anaerolineae bacterium]|nr:hypothetical protein [Anaerolineales bacterium]MCB8934150.1 hypothetical protein [Promineifilum sp.]MCW5845668.1 hypothetical protein [Anaerolineae bacterium]
MHPSNRWYKPALVIVGLFAAVWMVLEGDMLRDVVLAGLLLLVGLMALMRRWSWMRSLPPRKTVALAAVGGLAYGSGLVLLTLFLMTVKTGLHAHGPEYTSYELVWLWNQLLLWAAAGGLVGLGVGLLAVAARR